MTISYSWLLQYLPQHIELEQLCTILTSIGLEVEGTEAVEHIKGSLQGLVIGHVLECSIHPNADKLKKTKVQIAEGQILEIVCGASNVAIGQKVVVAPVGAWVHPQNAAAFEIKKSKIRGEWSEGMLCAEDEIGLGSSHDGIMVLEPNAPVGQAAATYFNIPAPEIAIYIGLTPNRSDAMSHIGVARDVCAYLSHHQNKKWELRYPNTDAILGDKTTFQIQIDDAAKDACKRYAALYFEEVQVGPSPDFIKNALQTIGLRSINNVVDITNYVLHEYGHPLHAFDAQKISGNTVKIGFMPEGTHFVSLDAKERKLLASDLMIQDAQGPLAMAGVMGGLSSAVSETTTTLFLESAFFDPGTIRKTSLKHQLRTDAATHFEKCVDIENVIPVLKRAAQLLIQYAGAKCVSPIIEEYPIQWSPQTIRCRYEYVQKLAGKYYSPQAIKSILQSLQFNIVKEDEHSCEVAIPSHKNDIFIEADLVEEILRIDGLDQIAIPERIQMSLNKNLTNDRIQKDKVAEMLCGMGLQEILTNSITNSNYYPDEPKLVRMVNSLTSELDVLRPEMLRSGLEVIQYNINRKNNRLQLFEFGKIYHSQAIGQYEETNQLALWLSGDARPASWMHKAEKLNIFYAKGIIESLLKQCGISKTAFSNNQDTLEWKWKNMLLAQVQQVDKTLLKEQDIKQEVYYVCISWDLWVEAMKTQQIQYVEIPKYPAVQRDLALVLDKNISYQEVEKQTKKLQIPILTHFELFDVFESEKLGADKKSYALSYTFQNPERTLTDAEVDTAMEQLKQCYQNKIQAQIRL